MTSASVTFVLFNYPAGGFMGNYILSCLHVQKIKKICIVQAAADRYMTELFVCMEAYCCVTTASTVLKVYILHFSSLFDQILA
jgi:hypothetical protein